MTASIALSRRSSVTGSRQGAEAETTAGIARAQMAVLLLEAKFGFDHVREDA